VHYLGEINDEELLIAAYSACDVFVIPSVQENLSNMVVEAMACNIPVVAFNIGGMPDMIKHKENGWLAKPFEVNDLATGIKWCLENKNIFSDNIRGAATEKFDLKIVAKQYRDLYQEIIDQKNKI
jgi:glycosyltransferase involved in cell wall biosynthesis